MAIKSSVFVDVVTKTDKSQKNLLKYAAVVGVAALAVKGLVAIGKKLVEAYKVQEQAEAKFIGALRATGTEALVSTKNFFTLASSLQQVTLYGDEATIEATALLQSLAKLNDEGLKTLVPLIQDFATGMRVDLNAAMSLVGKTLGSSTNALTRYGLVIDMTGTKEEKLASLTEELTNKFGGMAKAVADTATGVLEQLTHALGDLREEGGRVIAEAIKPIVSWLVQVVSKAAASAKELRAINEAIILFSKGTITELEDMKLALAEKESQLKTLGGEIKEVSKEGRTFKDVLNMMGESTVRGALATQNLNAAGIASTKVLAEEIIELKNLITEKEKQLALDVELARKRLEEEEALKDTLVWIDKVEIAYGKTTEGRLKAIDAEIAWFKMEQALAVKTAHMFEPILEMLYDQRDALIEISKIEQPTFNIMNTELEGIRDKAYEVAEQMGLIPAVIELAMRKTKQWADSLEPVVEEVDKLKETLRIIAEETIVNIGQAFGAMIVEGEGLQKLLKVTQDVLSKVLLMYAKEWAVLAVGSLIPGPTFNPVAAVGYTAAAIAASAGAGAIQAFDKGGIINEPVFGIGASGQRYTFGESGPEEVRPIGKGSPGITFNISGNTFAGAGGMREFVLELKKEFNSQKVLGI